MNILFFGDIVGRAGRTELLKQLPDLRKRWKVDFVCANAENTTSGIGLNPEHAKLLLENGVDCITLGDHSFDQKEMLSYIENEPRILRPLNFARAAPGKGFRVFKTMSGERVAVVQVLGQVFMKKSFADPFHALDTVLKELLLGHNCDAILVDIHAEATSEKMALGHWCDGRVTLAVGTHTHVPTRDLQILEKGTAYLSDAGMCGDYNSVIGMNKLEPISRFVTGMIKTRFSPASGPATLCGVFVEVEKGGFSKNVGTLSLGGSLSNTLPDFLKNL